MVRFSKRGKLSSRNIRPFEVLERVGMVSYRFVLPPNLPSVHVAFHVSILRKYTLDLTHVVDWGELVVDVDGTFEEGLVRIMDSWNQVLRRKTVKLVKVLLQHRGVEEVTWERDDTMHTNYPFLFEDANMFSCHFEIKMTIVYACDCMYECEYRGRNSFKGRKM